MTIRLDLIKTLMLLLIVVTVLLYDCNAILKNKQPHRSKKNLNIVHKKLLPVEIYENVPVGYTIIDLRSNLVEHHANNEEVYFKFEFIIDSNQNTGSLLDHFNLQHHKSYNDHHPHIKNENENSQLNLVDLRSFFLLESFTGILKTSKSLDLENFCELNICQMKLNENEPNRAKSTCSVPFRVKASKYLHRNTSIDSSEPIREAIFNISFKLIILDVNEFKPEFQEHLHDELIVLNVTEEFSPIKLLVGSVATDNDCTDRNNLIYFIKIAKVNNQTVDKLLKNSNSSYKFVENINHQFNFTVLTDQSQSLLFLYSPKPLDRELVQSIEVNLIASDRKNLNEANIGVLKIFMNIIDINDNSPKFETKIINLEIDEGLSPGTEIVQLKATDLDYGLNGKIQYEFGITSDEIKETFQLNSTTGMIKLLKTLNFDQKNFWHLSVKANDQSMSARKSTNALVNIKVNDVNNHRPEINTNFFLVNGFIGTRSVITRDVNENSFKKEDLVYLKRSLPANTAIGLLNVADRDSYTNGLIENCQLNHLNLKLNQKPILHLDEITYEFNTSFLFTSDSKLNKELESLYKSDIKVPERENEKKYLIRTSFDLNDENGESYDLEIKASDNGINYKLITKKSIKIMIINPDNIYKDKQKDTDQTLSMMSINQDITDLEDSASLKSIYNICIEENNQVPIEITKFVPSDFEMSSDVYYSLDLLPEFIMMINFDMEVFRCSNELKNHLLLGPLTGVLVLNKSIDREVCSDFLLIVKASHLNEKRLSSFIFLQLHIKDQNDNLASFESGRYVFDVLENAEVNKSIGYPIKILDQDIGDLSSLTFKLRSIENEKENSRINLIDQVDSFAIFKEPESNQIIFILKEPLDFENRKNYKFDLIVTDETVLNKKIMSKEPIITKIEINVIDTNEHKPFVKHFQSFFKDRKFLNLTKISNIEEDYLIVVNSDNYPEPKQHDAYFDLIELSAFDLDLSENFSKLNISLFSIKYFEVNNENDGNLKESLMKEFNNTKICNQSSIFLAESDEILQLKDDLNNKAILKAKQFPCPFPLVMIVVIKISDNGVPALFSYVNIKLIFIDNQMKEKKLYELKHHLIEKYSSKPNFYLTSKHTDSKNLTKLNTFDSISKQIVKKITFQSFLTDIHHPLVIVSILIFVLILTVVSLFIISIVYSVSVCKIFNCKVNDSFKNETIIESTKNTDQAVKSIDKIKYKEQSKEDDEHYFYEDEEKSDSSNNNNKAQIENRFITWINNIRKNEENVVNNMKIGKILKNNDKEDCFLDSPIIIKKFCDVESQSNYVKKNNLEYLLNKNLDHDINKKRMLTKEINKIKKISFKCEDQKLLQNKMKNSKSSATTEDKINMNSKSTDDQVSPLVFDDDLVITPERYKKHHLVQNSYNKNQFYTRRHNTCLENGNQFNQETLTSYQKASLQPEDNIWIKKTIPITIPNHNFINNEIVI